MSSIYRFSPVKHPSLRMTKKQEELFKRLFNDEHNHKGNCEFKKEKEKTKLKEEEWDHDHSCDSIIPEYILKNHTKYGRAEKIDKVNAYLRFNEYWRATPILNNKKHENNKLNKEAENIETRIVRTYKDDLVLPIEKRIMKTKIREIRQPILYKRKLK